MMALLSVGPRLSPRITKLQERLDGGARQRDRITVDAALARVRPQRLAGEVRQPSELGFAVKLQQKRLLVGKHVLAECGTERGEPLDNLGEPLLGGGVEPGAGAAEIRVVALQHAFLLGVELEAVDLADEVIDAAE